HNVNGQNIPASASQDFHTASSAIARRTENSYRLVRIGSNKAPAILAPGKGAKEIPEAGRNNEEAVRSFAISQALVIADRALSLPNMITLSHAQTERTGNLWLSSFTASYNG